MKHLCAVLLLVVYSISVNGHYPSELTETNPLKPPEELLKTRIPQTLYPNYYVIWLKPYFPSNVTYPKDREFTFDGKITINVTVASPTRNITLNAKNLTFDNAAAAVCAQDGRQLTVTKLAVDADKSQVIVHLDENLQLGSTYNVSLAWAGNINDFKTASFFKTAYVLPNEEKKHWMVASHFEEGGMLRSTMPSFDEPMYKSFYHLTLQHPTGMKALGNGMELATKDLGTGWSETSFAPLKSPMSSYLLAFAIGDFVGVQRENKHGVLVRVWAWPGMEPYLDLPLDVGCKALDWFSDYFGIDFPLEKEDLLGLPEFRPGAMENWGLVIFRHAQMAYNVHMDTSEHMAQSVVETIVHELAHQWFGDLVTARWWNDLFLHESFATYWETVASFGIFPDQGNMLDVSSPLTYLEKGLKFDGQRRLSHPVIDPLGPYFDAITYKKGGSLLRMINHTLSEPLFRESLRVAAENNIIDWCGRPLNFTTFLMPWFRQQGFPTIVVRKNEHGIREVYQRAYQNFTELNLPETPYGYQWPIPDWSQHIKDKFPARLTWLVPEALGSECGAASTINRPSHGVVVENAASRAFARVLYGNDSWLPIKEYILENPKAFDVFTRTQLLNDALVFMETPEIPSYQRFMDLSLYLAKETAFAPWKYAVLPEYEQFINDFMLGEEYPLLLQYFRETIQPVYEKLGWERQDDWDLKMLDYAIADVDNLGGEALKALSSNLVAEKIMWTYFKNNVAKVVHSSVRHEYLDYMTKSWRTQNDIDIMSKLRTDLGDQLSDLGQSALVNATKNVQTHKYWYETLGHTISDWLRERYSLPTPNARYTRLPSADTTPLKYDVTIQPYFPSSKAAVVDGKTMFTFDGQTQVVVKCDQPTNEIYLNADKLTVTGLAVKKFTNDEEIPLAESGITTYPEVQQINVMLQHGLQKGMKYKIFVNYTGVVNDVADDGLFKVRYTTKEGEEKWVLATQFEHIRARSVFPSYDEPAYKTPFTMTVIHPSDMVAIGNMPVEAQVKLLNGWTSTRFAQTPPMSSYLVAFVVGDLVSATTTNAHGVQIGVWDRPGTEKMLGEALHTANRTMEFFANYLDEAYPLPKLDVVGLAQFHGGGMENWGLITMKSEYTYHDTKHQNTTDLAKLAKIVTHEVAHQWFGDLVTMEWWEEIFLNEGFAQYWEFAAPQAAYPKQEKYFSTRYVPEILNGALFGDAKNTSHALHFAYAKDPDFGSSITYEKGAAVIRMLRFVLGNAAFQEALQKYMDEHHFGNTQHNDLFNAMTATAGKYKILDWCGKPLNVTTLMAPWLEQNGFPVVKIASTASALALTQHPYNSDMQNFDDNKWGYKWPVPIWYSTKDNTDTLAWLTPRYYGKECDLTSDLDVPKDAVIKLEARVYAIVDYDQSAWTQLLQQIRTDPFSMTTNVRAQILNDMKMLIMNDPTYLSRFLDIGGYLAAETNLAPWDIADGLFNEVKHAVSNVPYSRFVFKRYLLGLYSAAYDNLNAMEDKGDWDTIILRALVTRKACGLGYTTCVTRAAQEFRKFIDTCPVNPGSRGIDACAKPLDPETGWNALCTGMTYSTNILDFVKLLNLYKSEMTIEPPTPAAKMILNGLVCTGDISNLKTLMDYASTHKDASTGKEIMETILGQSPSLALEPNATAVWNYLLGLANATQPNDGPAAGVLRHMWTATQRWNTDNQLHAMQQAYVIPNLKADLPTLHKMDMQLRKKNLRYRQLRHEMASWANDSKSRDGNGIRTADLV